MVTLAALHLFNVDKGAEKMNEEKAQLFHHLVSKLLYQSCRSRQYIQTVVFSVHRSRTSKIIRSY